MTSLEIPSAYDFAAAACPDPETQQQELRRLVPGQPLLELTPTTALSVAHLARSWIFTVSRGRRVAGVAVGFVKQGRFLRSLEVIVGSKLPETNVFWDRLRKFARTHRIANVTIEAVGEVRAEIPPLEGESGRTEETAWLIELETCDLAASLSKNHQRNMRRAVKNGAELVECTDAEAIKNHLRLCGASLARRSSRGETAESHADAALFEAYLRSGQATFFQARIGDRVLSSDLVVRLGDAAYYTSGGSDLEGTKLGTSHFLMFELARQLQGAGCKTLNLGVSQDPGLNRFKAGFGARPVPLERVTLEWGSAWNRWRKQAIVALVSLIRRG
ncbi:MAG: GNAT family N-acetyltransferase [Planctomycetota bacterium]|jgi:hypothetical protein